MSWCSLRTWGLAAAVALVCSGCAQTVHSQVSSYSQLPRERSQLSYAIIPLADQRKDEAFESYEQRVRAHLAAYGFVPQEFDRAEYIVAMAYVSDDRGDAISSYPIIGQTGSSSSRMSGTMHAYRNTTSYSTTTAHTPAYDVAAADADSDELTSVLRLDIVRRASIGRGHIEKVYEGEVLSASNGRELAEILPAMIEALFQDFPGTDGEVRHVASKSVPGIDEIAGLHTARSCPGGADCEGAAETPERPEPARAANARPARCGMPGTRKLRCARRASR